MEAVNLSEAKDDHQKRLVRVFSKVSGQVGSSVQKCESKSSIVRFTNVVILKVHTETDLLLPQHCILRQENLNMMSLWLAPLPVVEYVFEVS